MALDIYQAVSDRILDMLDTRFDIPGHASTMINLRVNARVGQIRMNTCLVESKASATHSCLSPFRSPCRSHPTILKWLSSARSRCEAEWIRPLGVVEIEP
jgi:hypothetical protein